MGPLQGVRIVEFAGLGPGPFAAMLLADMGAEVVRIERKGAPAPQPWEVVLRGREAVALDLKSPAGVEAALQLIERADGLIEGFRPGVMERLGLDPVACHARRPQLVYGRMTGWGQSGPLSHTAGHDINYVALSGALHAIGRADSGPTAPLNLVGDYGGGALYLALGLVSALLAARTSGIGQVVDVAMSDGALSLMSAIYGRLGGGLWKDSRASNMLDGGAHFYDTYETRDGRWVAIGAIEAKFYAELLRRLGVDDPAFDAQMDQEAWPHLKAKLAQVIKLRTRDELDALLGGSDACYAPVLSLFEAPRHPHNLARGAFVEIEGTVQPAPAPRFSRTPSEVRGGPQAPRTEAVLRTWGFSDVQVAELASRGAI